MYVPYEVESSELQDRPPTPYREVFRTGAFREGLRAGHRVDVLINHAGDPVASTADGGLRVTEDDNGVYVTFTSPDVAPDIQERARNRRFSGVSPGFRFNESGRLRSADQRRQTMVRAVLTEVSLTTRTPACLSCDYRFVDIESNG